MTTTSELEELVRLQGEHSIFAPSAAHRWLECPGSLIPSLMAPDTAGYDAAWGTVGHELAEEWLRTGVKPERRLGETVVVEEDTETFQIEISRSMMRHVGRYVAWCDEVPGERYVEEKVYFSQLTPIPRQGGTADFLAIFGGTLYLRDLKLGIYVQVFAPENPQGMLYALGAYYRLKDEHSIKRVNIGIGQPRLDHWDIWEISVDELLAFAERVRQQAALAWSLDAYRKPGAKQCQFCPVKGECPALLKQVELIAMKEFDAMGKTVATTELAEVVESNRVAVGRLPSPHSLTVEQMVQLMQYRLPVENFFKAVETRLNNLAQRGEQIPDRKLVRSRTNRVFRNESEAADLLELYGLSRSDLLKEKMRSPKEVADLLANAGYSDESIDRLYTDIVFKPPGRPTLVPLSDQRPAISEEYDDIFGDLAEGGFDDLNDDL